MKIIYSILTLIILTTSLFAQNPTRNIRLKQGILQLPDKETFETEKNFNIRSQRYLAVNVKEHAGNAYLLLKQYGEENIVSKLDGNTYIILCTQSAATQLKNDTRINSIFFLPGKWKKAPGYAPSGKYIVTCYSGDQNGQLVSNVPGIGILSNRQGGKLTFIEITATPEQIEKVADLDYVQYISNKPNEYIPINYDKHSLEGDGEAQASTDVGGLGLDGSGVTIGIGDNGYYTHVDLDDRVTNFASDPTSNHSVHVSGITAGSGHLQPLYKGKAPKANLLNIYFYDDVTQAPSFYNGNNMRVTNNSYGVVDGVSCPYYGDYNGYSQEVDQQAFDLPGLLHVFAAGNSGGSTCSPYPPSYNTVFDGPQVSKNTITVGALEKEINGTISSYSSKGPSDDGRLKPEISTLGNSTSCLNNSTYGGSTGTSMATPSVTGAVGLIQQSYKLQHSGSYPPTDLIKAVLCNTADDIQSEGPDFGSGYGRLNTSQACVQINNTNNVTSSITEGNTNQLPITIPSGTTKIAITLCWNDPAADPAAAKSLVNDLDLELTDGTNTTYPWILDPSITGCTNPAVRGVDTLNNMEKISIINPVAGSYTIKVKGTEVMGTQDYALTYYTEDDAVHISAPFAGEKYNIGQGLRYKAEVGSIPLATNATYEFSSDGGGSWTSMSFPYVFPTVTTKTARVRATDNSSGNMAVTGDFTVAAIPQNISAVSLCPGYAAMTWTSIANATSYKIYKKTGDAMVYADEVTTNSATVPGLSTTNQELLSVTAVYAGGIESERGYGAFVLANTGACSWDRDLAAISILSPETGRKNTSTELSTESITLRIKNLGNQKESNFQLYYKINNGSNVIETYTGLLDPGASLDYTFTTSYNFSAVGTYVIESGIYGSPDAPYDNNNTVQKTISQLENDQITVTDDLGTTFKVDFQNALDTAYTTDFIGVKGIDRFDYHAGTAQSRLRFFVTGGIAESGTQAASLDATGANSSSLNELTMTVNLSHFDTDDPIRLDFSYLNHNSLLDAGDKVWIRGRDSDPWIQAYDLFLNQSPAGQYKKVYTLNIAQILEDNSQQFSTSTQIKFGQQGTGSIVDKQDKGGYTFDDIYIHSVANDVEVQQIISPSPKPCGLTANESIITRIANTSSNTINNISVWYKLNNTTYGPFTISSINGQSYVDYSIPNVDLSANQWYNLSVWANFTGDSYHSNDTIKNYLFYNSPFINTYPYLETFESSDGGWQTYGDNDSWNWGTPANGGFNRAASGTHVWGTNTSGSYNNNETSYLESPCFDLSALTGTVKLSFSMAQEIETDYDRAWVEYSNDGLSWTKLGSINTGTNWYNDGSNYWDNQRDYWHVATQNITGINGSSVRFRFVFSSDPGLALDGLTIDDIHIYTSTPIYQSSNTSVTQTLNANAWNDITSGGSIIASINPQGNNLGSTQTAVYFNPNNSTRHDGIQFYLDRNFSITPTNQITGNDVLVRLYYTDLENDSCRLAVGNYDKPQDAYEMGVTQVSSDVDDGIFGDETNATITYHNYQATDMVPWDNGYYVQFPVSGFSEFYVNSGGVNNNKPLPLTILQFTAQKSASHTGIITYKVANDKDISTIEIEKSRNVNFIEKKTIFSVRQSGEKTVVKDEDISNAGIVYYRLSAFGQDGYRYYSPLRIINYGDQWDVNLSPNPATDNVSLHATGLNTGATLSIEVFNSLGKSVLQKQVIAIGDQLNQTINITGWESGVYLFRISAANDIKMLKMIKSNP